jgi:pimeloyl-ACP methyl ester carboxylesterase
MADNVPTATDTVVLVHGFWVTPRSWEKWIERYEGKGYRVIAPAYPGSGPALAVIHPPGFVRHYYNG